MYTNSILNHYTDIHVCKQHTNSIPNHYTHTHTNSIPNHYTHTYKQYIPNHYTDTHTNSIPNHYTHTHTNSIPNHYTDTHTNSIQTVYQTTAASTHIQTEYQTKASCTDIITIIIIIAFKGAIRDFLQSPHSAANCFQHVRSSGMGAIVCKSRATHRALITCKCHVTCHLVRRDSSAITFDRVAIAFI